MKDFIFVTGASGIGKTTLANGLLEHYKTTCIEQHMVPDFISRDGSEPMTGELEELTCWENQVAMLMCFHRLGYKNIIASDIDDLSEILLLTNLKLMLRVNQSEKYLNNQ